MFSHPRASTRPPQPPRSRRLGRAARCILLGAALLAPSTAAFPLEPIRDRFDPDEYPQEPLPPTIDAAVPWEDETTTPAPDPRLPAALRTGRDGDTPRYVLVPIASFSFDANNVVAVYRARQRNIRALLWVDATGQAQVLRVEAAWDRTHAWCDAQEAGACADAVGWLSSVQPPHTTEAQAAALARATAATEPRDSQAWLNAALAAPVSPESADDLWVDAPLSYVTAPALHRALAAAQTPHLHAQAINGIRDPDDATLAAVLALHWALPISPADDDSWATPASWTLDTAGQDALVARWRALPAQTLVLAASAPDRLVEAKRRLLRAALRPDGGPPTEADAETPIDVQGVLALTALLLDEDGTTARLATHVVGQHRVAALYPTVCMQAINDPHPHLRAAAVEALLHAQTDLCDAFALGLADRDASVRLVAANRLLARLPDADAQTVALAHLSFENWEEVRVAIVRALSRHGTPGALPQLVLEAIDDEVITRVLRAGLASRSDQDELHVITARAAVGPAPERQTVPAPTLDEESAND